MSTQPAVKPRTARELLAGAQVFLGHQVAPTSWDQVPECDTVIYIVELATGMVKIGRGETSRVSNHAELALRAGVAVRRVWVSDVVPEMERAEKLLLQWARARGHRCVALEWFDGLSFEDAMQEASESVEWWTAWKPRFRGGGWQRGATRRSFPDRIHPLDDIAPYWPGWSDRMHRIVQLLHAPGGDFDRTRGWHSMSTHDERGKYISMGALFFRRASAAVDADEDLAGPEHVLSLRTITEWPPPPKRVSSETLDLLTYEKTSS